MIKCPRCGSYQYLVVDYIRNVAKCLAEYFNPKENRVEKCDQLFFMKELVGHRYASGRR